MIEILAETQTIQSARTSESSVTAPVCQTTQVEIGEVIEIGASIPAESASSIFVTAPVLENSPVVVGSEQPAHVAEYMTLEPMVSEIRDLKSDLVHIRELLGVLVRKERSAEAKAEIAARRLNRMEGERDQESEAECEATLEEAPVDHSKVVKVIVDKWFVDKGFGFGKTPTGQVVFIHTSAVQGAEVLKIGTDARVEVVNDDARAREVQSQTCLGTRRVESGEGQERGNKVAQQVRRAAALTAELAVQSEKKTAAVCDQPPGLDELAGHIEAPNMGAGGSHPQVAMMSDPWATYKCPSASNNQAVATASSETNRIPADRGVLAQTRVFRGARLRSATRAPSTRSRGPNLTKEESRQRTAQSRNSVFVGRKKKHGNSSKGNRLSCGKLDKTSRRSSGRKYWAASTGTARTSKRDT